MEILQERNKKIEILKKFTSSEEYIGVIDNIAFNQDELYDILDNDSNIVYLCGEKFSIPLAKKDITYLGINNPIVVINSNEVVDWNEKRITLKNVTFDEKYMSLISDNGIKEAENLFLNYDIERAFSMFKKLAITGNGRAMYFLGEIYTNGFGRIVIDKNEGYSWFLKGFNAKDILAKVKYACLLENKIEAKNIISSCLSDLEEESKNNMFAQYEFGHLFRDSSYTEKNIDKYITLLRKCSEDGYWFASYKLGEFYNDSNSEHCNYSDAYKFFVKGAEKGHGLSAYNVAECYYNGNGVSENYSMAYKWAEKAYEDGVGDGANMIGVLYYIGNGVEQNYNLANEWFLKGAELDCPEAQYDYALMYKNGTGVEKNLEKAFEYFLKASENGHKGSIDHVIYAYINGEGVKRDCDKALGYLKIGAINNSGYALNQLACWYEEGAAFERDSQKAFYLYTKAIENKFEYYFDHIAELCHLNEREKIITARNGLVYFSSVRTENFFERCYELYACDYQANKVCLFSFNYNTLSFNADYQYVQNTDYLVISITLPEVTYVLNISGNEAYLLSECKYASGASVSLELNGDSVDIYENLIKKSFLTNIKLNKKDRDPVNIEDFFKNYLNPRS